MTTLYRTTVSAVGADAADLLEGGVLILFADGAPPELAEVSVLHTVETADTTPPVPGDHLVIAGARFAITAVGDTAWAKVSEIGHVVFSFNGASVAERPGEICVETTDTAHLVAQLKAGVTLSVERG